MASKPDKPSPGQTLRSLMWSHIDRKRTNEAGGDWLLYVENHVSTSMPAGSTPRDYIEQLARKAPRPIPIVALDKCLDEPRYPRGGLIFGDAGSLIDKYVSNYPGLGWWIEREGLVIGMLRREDSPPEFDRKAGKLCAEHAVGGRLSYEGLTRVAAALDAAGFPFMDNLEPAQRKTFAAAAQKARRPAPKTFAEAVAGHKRADLIRAVRQRLSRAKVRYERSIS